MNSIACSKLLSHLFTKTKRSGSITQALSFSFSFTSIAIERSASQSFNKRTARMKLGLNQQKVQGVFSLDKRIFSFSLQIRITTEKIIANETEQISVTIKKMFGYSLMN